MSTIIKKAKAEFIRMVINFSSDPYHLMPHVPEAEKWAKKMMKKYLKADK